MMGKYMLIVQKVAGLSPTIVTGDDVEYLKELARREHGGYYSSPVGSHHEAVRIRIIEIRQLMIDWEPGTNFEGQL